MFDDLIKPKFKWDTVKYNMKPYCPRCGSENVDTLCDYLSGDSLTVEKRCLDCCCEWNEKYNSDLNLEMEERDV